ncbi:MAG: hypothetical protein O7D91_19300 [Planctomycetota bacterium]|nr:hypothetical protein [Planctomycetota bacterium]
MEITRNNLDLAFAAFSERQQLAMTRSLRPIPDFYLSIKAQLGGMGEEAYHNVLAWKGSVFARQRQIHVATRRPELAPLLSDLQKTSSQLATLAFLTPGPKQHEVWRCQLGELTKQKERLEYRLPHTPNYPLGSSRV